MLRAASCAPAERCGIGVFDQNVFVDTASDVVIASCSSRPVPLDAGVLGMTFAGKQIRNLLA